MNNEKLEKLDGGKSNVLSLALITSLFTQMEKLRPRGDHVS